MRKLILAFLLLGASTAFASGDVYQDLYNAVDRDHVVGYLKVFSGVTPINIGGRPITINERYSSQGKAKFRAYFEAFFKALGIHVQEMAYKTKHSNIEPQGHNIEAILPGQVADSIVVIIHYDSMGVRGHETENPGSDDDMTGMAQMFETARLLAQVRSRLHYTVRFVAADFEEWASPGLEGARVYARYISQLAAAQGFKIIASIDNEQQGWSGASNQIVDVFSCTKAGGRGAPESPFIARAGSFPDSKYLGDLYADTVQKYSQLKVQRACMGANSDFYAMLEVGVPSVVFSEHNPFDNPHFDDEGGDTFETIDQDYFFRLSQVAATFAGRVIGIDSKLHLN